MSSKYLLGLLPLLALSGCSDFMVRTQPNRQADFSVLKSYAWQPTPGQFQPKPPEDPAWDQRIRAAVDQELSAKGFRSADRDKADFIVAYLATTEERVDAHVDNYARAELMGLTYTLGMLKLRMTQGATPVTIWEGDVQAKLDASKPLEERIQRLQQAVQALLSKFP